MKSITLSGNKAIELSAPTKVKLFNAGANDSTKGTFIYNPELKETILNNQLQDGRDELPIDLAHLSLTNSETVAAHKAYGWFTLSLEDDGIYADKIKWTEEGKKLLENREFRFYSPAFQTNENNEIVFIDNFALTNEPALRDLQPLVASKLEPQSEAQGILESQSAAQGVVPCSNVENSLKTAHSELERPTAAHCTSHSLIENSKEQTKMSDEQKPDEEIKEEEVLAEEPVEEEVISPDEKDELLKEQASQIMALKDEVAQLMAKISEYESAAVEAEKSQLLSSLELSETENAFFSKLDLGQLKEYSTIRLSKIKEEKSKVKEVELIKENNEKDFVLSKAPKQNQVVDVKETLSYLPSKEDIVARAKKIAASRSFNNK